MKILLTNHDLSHTGGTETWTMTMLDYLSQNHDVDVYTATGNNNLIKATYDESKRYDLALINHNICQRQIKNWNIKKRIFTSHGIIAPLERPIIGADVYVGVSEEVQAKMKEIGFDAKVIRNPINTTYFTQSPVNKKLRNILFLHNRNIPPIVGEACRDYNYRVLTKFKSGVKENIDWADLIISSGRGCYEAMSCGKNVIVIGCFGCDGIVTWESIFELRKNNCSGRRYAFYWTIEEIQNEFAKYDPDRNMRPYILEHNNVETIAEQYLSL